MKDLCVENYSFTKRQKTIKRRRGKNREKGGPMLENHQLLPQIIAISIKIQKVKAFGS